jgi:hypothetical protein
MLPGAHTRSLTHPLTHSLTHSQRVLPRLSICCRTMSMLPVVHILPSTPAPSKNTHRRTPLHSLQLASPRCLSFQHATGVRACCRVVYSLLAAPKAPADAAGKLWPQHHPVIHRL